jgi:hypothetical protein
MGRSFRRTVLLFDSHHNSDDDDAAASAEQHDHPGGDGDLPPSRDPAVVLRD